MPAWLLPVAPELFLNNPAPLILMRHFLLSLILLILGLAIPGGQALAADSASGSWQITADRITREDKPPVVIAEGNVVLRRSGEVSKSTLVLKADWVRYNVNEGTVHARGNFSMRTAGEDVAAAEARVNLNDETATLTETRLFVPESNLHFSGSQVEKEDGVTYRFTDGRFTTCPKEEGRTSPWRFDVARATVRTEGVSVLKHTVLRIKDIPVFYVPYLSMSTDNKRKSGFLLPELSQSTRSGAGLITPFFVNLSSASDITLYPGFLADRGPVAGVEFRYVTDYDQKGTLALTYLNDKTTDSTAAEYKADDYQRTANNRYWLRGKVTHPLTDDTTAMLDLDMASDRDYLEEFAGMETGFEQADEDFRREFGRGLDESTLPYRLSRAQITRTWPSMLVAGQIMAVDELVDDSNQTHSLPRLIFDGLADLPGSDMELTWTSEYVNYWREQGVGEHRFDFHPRLVSSLPFGNGIEGIFSLGLRETMYRIETYGSSTWADDRNQMRTAWDIGATIGTTLIRDFNLKVGNFTGIGHQLRPELAYDYQTVTGQDQLPGLDQLDQLSTVNRLTYSLNNYFYGYGQGVDGASLDRYLGYLKLSLSYDIHEARGADVAPFGDLELDLNLYPVDYWQLRYRTALNVHGEGIDYYNLLARYRRKAQSFSLDYRFQQDGQVDELNAAFRTPLAPMFYLEGGVKQSFYLDELVNASLGLSYQQSCWAARLKAEKTSDDERISLMFSLYGLGHTLGAGVSGDLDEGFDLSAPAYE